MMGREISALLGSQDVQRSLLQLAGRLTVTAVAILILAWLVLRLREVTGQSKLRMQFHELLSGYREMYEQGN